MIRQARNRNLDEPIESVVTLPSDLDIVVLFVSACLHEDVAADPALTLILSVPAFHPVPAQSVVEFSLIDWAGAERNRFRRDNELLFLKNTRNDLHSLVEWIELGPHLKKSGTGFFMLLMPSEQKDLFGTVLLMISLRTCNRTIIIAFCN